MKGLIGAAVGAGAFVLWRLGNDQSGFRCSAAGEGANCRRLRATDVSARRYYRHHHRHGYRPYYRPYYYARPDYFRPYPYYAAGAVHFGVSFGPFW